MRCTLLLKGFQHVTYSLVLEPRYRVVRTKYNTTRTLVACPTRSLPLPVLYSSFVTSSRLPLFARLHRVGGRNLVSLFVDIMNVKGDVRINVELASPLASELMDVVRSHEGKTTGA